MSQPKFAHSRKRGKKPLLMGITVLLVIAALIGGAFAWTDFTQSKTNKFKGTNDADVTLHDEFDGTNKDVFVENSGTSTIYVRVRLDEFMQIADHVFQMSNAGASGSPRPIADVRDKATWIPHTYGQFGIPSDFNDCNHTDIDPDKFHNYYQWDMSGEYRGYLPGTPGMVYTTLGANGRVDTNPTDGKPTATAMPPTPESM